MSKMRNLIPEIFWTTSDNKKRLGENSEPSRFVFRVTGFFITTLQRY